MSSLPLVSIIIINWNGGEILKTCLKSLSSLIYPNWELIVVDNGSLDGSLDHLNSVKLKARKIITIKNHENLGFAPANNQGFKKSQGKYILLLNNDTKVKPNFLNKLIAKMENDTSLGVIQPKIHIMDNPKYLDNCGSFFTKTGFLEHWGYFGKDGKQFDKEKLVFSVKGACMLTKREVIEKVGLFDDRFMSYFEETDFCWRVWLSGWDVVYFPGANIFHKVGFTSKKQDQILVNYHSMKNRLASLIKNLNTNNLFRIGSVHLLLIMALSLFYLVKLQISKFKMIWQAIFWNFTNINETLKQRSKIQLMRTRTDQEIFKNTLKKVNFNEMFKHFMKVEANFK